MLTFCFGSTIILHWINLKQRNVWFRGNNDGWREHNTNTSAWWGIGLWGGGTVGSTSRGTSRWRRPNALRGRPKPINLEVLQDPNILTNPRWQDEKGMWMYNTIRRYVDGHIWWEYLFWARSLIISKQKYGLWKEVSYKIVRFQCPEVWEYDQWSLI